MRDPVPRNRLTATHPDIVVPQEDDLGPEQHQRLKAMAALSGQTIKDYILERALPALPEANSLSEEEALRQLEAFLKPRIEEAERGEMVNPQN
jgi:hypothetical protein